MQLDNFTSETVLWLVRLQTDLDCIRTAQCPALENMKWTFGHHKRRRISWLIKWVPFFKRQILFCRLNTAIHFRRVHNVVNRWNVCNAPNLHAFHTVFEFLNDFPKFARVQVINQTRCMLSPLGGWVGTTSTFAHLPWETMKATKESLSEEATQRFFYTFSESVNVEIHWPIYERAIFPWKEHTLKTNCSGKYCIWF